jgi:hypothetical protein
MTNDFSHSFWIIGKFKKTAFHADANFDLSRRYKGKKSVIVWTEAAALRSKSEHQIFWLENQVTTAQTWSFTLHEFYAAADSVSSVTQS